MTAAARSPSGALDAPYIEEGTRVGGRFVVEDLLGEGGMGAVYRAHDTVIDRYVALKVLHLNEPQASERFRLEAAAASRISSRHVAAVHDFGRDEDLGCEFLVLELLDGHPLDAVLAREETLTASQAASIGADIAEALAAAHAANVVHRDLKPANVWCLREGGVKVIDFGIARVMASDNRSAHVSLTNPNTILGTPTYISPEAVEGTEVGPPADLYALGVILFEMVAGEPPFWDDVPSALCTLHLREPPPLIGDVNPGAFLPPGYEGLVSGLLEKDPATRPPDALEVAEILRGLTDETSMAALRLEGVARTGGAKTAKVRRRNIPRSRLPLMVAIGISLLTIALLAVVLVLVLRGPAPEPELPAPLIDVTAVVEPTEEAPLEVPDEVTEDVLPAAAPARVEVTLDLRPPTATLHLDGELVDGPLTLPDDSSEHELSARAAGYRPQTVTVRGDRDREIRLRLRRRRRGRPGLPAKFREW